jgi:hypothetical protein
LDVKDLKNYGADVATTLASLPQAIWGKMEALAGRVALKRFGLLKILQLPGLIKEEEAKIRAVDPAAFRARGLDKDELLPRIITQVAAFAAVARLAGTDKAVSVFEEITREVGAELWAAQLPPPDDFKRCGDGFGAFRAYFDAMMAANRRVGVLDYEVVEDGPDAVQYDVTSCVFCELAERLGYRDAARHLCLADDVYFPVAGRELGLCFVRKGTLARGDQCCDFRFERAPEADRQE